MEIGWLVRHPGHEFRQRRIFQQRGTVSAEAHERGVGEIGMDRPVADRVDRHGYPALFRLRNRVVQLDPAT